MQYQDRLAEGLARGRSVAVCQDYRMEGDATYFSRRASEERAAAMKAAHPNARQAHLDMAGRYDDLAQSIRERSRYFELHLIKGSVAS